MDEPLGSDPDLTRLCAVIRSLRVRAGLTQHELAAMAAMTKPEISRIEHGRTMPTYTRLCAILRALGAGIRIETANETVTLVDPQATANEQDTTEPAVDEVFRDYDPETALAKVTQMLQIGLSPWRPGDPDSSLHCDQRPWRIQAAKVLADIQAARR